MTNILVVEDDENILELVSYNLIKEGYTVYKVTSGEDALNAINNTAYDLIILDLMLPGMSGLDVCKELKSNPDIHNISVIILTARGEDSDIVTGLELGADDYVTKPFSINILLSRIKAVLRRNKKFFFDKNSVVKIHDMVIRPDKHEVLIQNNSVTLTSKEFKVLYFLASNPGWTFTRYQIIDIVRGDKYEITDRAVDVLIVGLRKKLDSCNDYIETVRGVGYRFKE